jgi:hypothetical protein
MYGRGNNISVKINDRLTDPFTPEVFILTFKHQSLQYWCKISSLCWSPSALLEMRTKSSAYSSKDVISFPDKLTESSRSIFSRIFEKSFKKI